MRTAISTKALNEMYQRLAAEAREAQNPDSEYWFKLAKYNQHELERLIGDKPYETWAELVWPGDVIDGVTWQQIYQQTRRAVNEAMQGMTDLQTLANVATYEWQSIPEAYGL